MENVSFVSLDVKQKKVEEDETGEILRQMEESPAVTPAVDSSRKESRRKKVKEQRSVVARQQYGGEIINKYIKDNIY